jgi:nitroreductase
VKEIFDRASVREFTNQELTDAQIEQLLRAAMAAPSACNQQPWEFFLAKDEPIKLALSKATPFAKPAAGAALCIVVCGRTQDMRALGCVPQDLSAAIENLLLEAVHLNLGGVWMAVAPDADRIANVAQIIGNPEGVEPFALVALGHPAKEPAPKGATRYDESRVHWI